MFCNWIYELEDEADISGNILTIATRVVILVKTRLLYLQFFEKRKKNRKQQQLSLVFYITIGFDLMSYIVLYYLVTFLALINPFLRLRQLGIWWIGNKKDAAERLRW